MTNKPIQTALNFLLRAAGARGTNAGSDEKTSLLEATSPGGLSGARDAFAGVVNGMSPFFEGVAIGHVDPVSVAILDPHELTPYLPPFEWEQTVSVATKPWVVQGGEEENQNALVGTKPWLFQADGDENQSVWISTKPCASYEDIALANAMREAAQFAGGGVQQQQGSVQQLIQAMAGFAPPVPGSGLTVSSAFQAGLGGVLASPQG